jgi:hypothetical protein
MRYEPSIAESCSDFCEPGRLQRFGESVDPRIDRRDDRQRRRQSLYGLDGGQELALDLHVKSHAEVCRPEVFRD